MNRVLLTGRLTRDPEMRTVSNGKTVTQFSIATNEYRGGPEKAEFHTVVTWDRLAEICSQYLGKGQLVAIEGRLQTRQWEDERKIRHWKTEIVANQVEMLSGRRKKDYAPNRRRRRSRCRRPSWASSRTSSRPPPLDQELDDDDLLGDRDDDGGRRAGRRRGLTRRFLLPRLSRGGRGPSLPRPPLPALVGPMTEPPTGEQPVIVVIRIADMPQPQTPAERSVCTRCREPVWLGYAVRIDAPFGVPVCLLCALPELQRSEPIELTPEVRRELLEWARRRRD